MTRRLVQLKLAGTVLGMVYFCSTVYATKKKKKMSFVSFDALFFGGGGGVYLPPVAEYLYLLRVWKRVWFRLWYKVKHPTLRLDRFLQSTNRFCIDISL